MDGWMDGWMDGGGYVVRIVFTTLAVYSSRTGSSQQSFLLMFGAFDGVVTLRCSEGQHKKLLFPNHSCAIRGSHFHEGNCWSCAARAGPGGFPGSLKVL